MSFSGDKLLGGPQAGILAGDAELVARLRRNPMFRALRLDKLIYQALETTLRNLVLERWDQIPALRMISRIERRIAGRARTASAGTSGRLRAKVIEGSSMIGGGSTPGQPLPELADRDRLRGRGGSGAALPVENDPPVVARIEDGRLLLDLRTVLPMRKTNWLARSACGLLRAATEASRTRAVRSAMRSSRMLSFGSMRAFADAAQSIQRRNAERRGKVAVRAAAGGRFLQPRRRVPWRKRAPSGTACRMAGERSMGGRFRPPST